MQVGSLIRYISLTLSLTGEYVGIAARIRRQSGWFPSPYPGNHYIEIVNSLLLYYQNPVQKYLLDTALAGFTLQAYYIYMYVSEIAASIPGSVIRLVTETGILVNIVTSL